MRLIIAGGGTGGHLFPGIAVAEEFLSRDRSNEVLFVGTERGIEARVLPRLGYRLECIATTGLRGINFFSRIKGVWHLVDGIPPVAKNRQGIPAGPGPGGRRVCFGTARSGCKAGRVLLFHP